MVIEVNPRLPLPEPEVIPPELDALDILRLVYRRQIEVTPLQMKALMAAIPFERAKLSVSANVNVGMGNRLEEAHRAFAPQTARVITIEQARERGEVPDPPGGGAAPKA
jgi:hypothetical protein